MLSRRVILTAPPLTHMFACRETNFARVQRSWQYKLLIAQKKHDRSLAVQLFYETLLDEQEDRTFQLKVHLLQYKESRTENDGPEFVETWEHMQDDYETATLLQNCTDA